MTAPTCIAEVDIQAGTTILIPSGPSGDHLFVSVFEVKEIAGKKKILLAPIETQFAKCETTCTLVAGEHPFVRHDSFIGYKHCRIEDHAHVVACIKNGIFKIKYPPVSSDLLSRIQDGYLQSNRVPRYIKTEWG